MLNEKEKNRQNDDTDTTKPIKLLSKQRCAVY